MGPYPLRTSDSDVSRLAKNDANNIHPEIAARDEAQTKEVPVANDTETTWNEPLTTDESTRGADASGRNPETKEVEPLLTKDATQNTHTTAHTKQRVVTLLSLMIHPLRNVSMRNIVQELSREIDADGNKVTRIVGNNYQIVAGAEYVNVKGDVNLTIDSNCKTYIKGNWDIQVDGNVNEVIKGTLTQDVTGAVSETYKANQTTNITGTLDLDASSEVDIDAGVINLN